MENLSLSELRDLQQLTLDKIIKVNRDLKSTRWSINDCMKALEDDEYIEDWLSYKEALNRGNAKLKEILLDITKYDNLHTKLENMIDSFKLGDTSSDLTFDDLSKYCSILAEHSKPLDLEEFNNAVKSFNKAIDKINNN